MITQQLIEYVRQRVSEGVSREDITKELLSVNWGVDDLGKVFASSEVVTANVSSQNMPQAQATVRSDEKLKDMYGGSVKEGSAESVPSDTRKIASQQPLESFVPPSSFKSTPATHDSFWYRPVVIILALIVLMGIAGGGVYAYYAYTKQPSAISVLRGVFENKVKVHSFDFAATSTSATVTNIASSSLSSRTRGMVSGTKLYATTTAAEHGTVVRGEDKVHPDFNILLALRGVLSVATTSGTYSMSLHAILSQKAFDLKLLRGNVSVTSSNPQLRMGTVFVNAALAKISDRWVRLIDFANASSSQQFAKIFSVPSSPAVAKDMKGLRAYAESLQYIRSARNVGIEYLNGVPTYHLSLVIQNTPSAVLMVQRLAYDYFKSLSGSNGGAEQPMPFADFLQTTKGLDTTLTQKIPFDIWIGKNDSRIYKFTTPNITFVSVGDKGKGRLTLREEFRFSNYNSTAPIVPPKNVESLKSFTEGIFGSGYSGGI